jgi:hypothetical protein
MDQEQKRRLDEIGFVFSNHKEKWNLQLKKLQDYYKKHGHCELLWDADRFSFILNTLTYTPHVSLAELQAICHLCMRKTSL